MLCAFIDRDCYKERVSVVCKLILLHYYKILDLIKIQLYLYITFMHKLYNFNNIVHIFFYRLIFSSRIAKMNG